MRNKNENSAKKLETKINKMYQKEYLRQIFTEKLLFFVNKKILESYQYSCITKSYICQIEEKKKKKV